MPTAPRPRVKPRDRVLLELRRRLQAREWPPGSQIPSHRSLARELGVSYETVRAAITVLVDEGKLETEPAWGTFVPDNHAGPKAKH